MQKTDVIVVGGGLVGMSIAFGLALLGRQVSVLDEGDDAIRAARGNFGLLWVQGKGYRMSPYARTAGIGGALASIRCGVAAEIPASTSTCANRVASSCA